MGADGAGCFCACCNWVWCVNCQTGCCQGTLCQTPNCKPQGIVKLNTTMSDQQHADGKTQVNDVHHIQRINSADSMSWKAGHNEFFNGMTFDDARVVLGTALNPEQVHPFLQDDAHATIQDSSIPTDFDARTQWPGLIHPIRNQMRCGSCWAFSASEVLSDRFAIASKAKSPVLSVEDMANSWETTWGLEGYFKMARGNNACGMESMGPPYAGLPQME